jgi:hypothetical protein
MPRARCLPALPITIKLYKGLEQEPKEETQKAEIFNCQPELSLTVTLSLTLLVIKAEVPAALTILAPENGKSSKEFITENKLKKEIKLEEPKEKSLFSKCVIPE